MIPPKKLPFATTTVDPERTKNEIVRLLKGFGISDYSWSEDGGMVSLAFKTEAEYDGEMKLWSVIIRPPILVETKKVYDEVQRMIVDKDIPNYRQSLRILLNHLKAKLTVVACGLTKFEEEFMADIAVPTSEGPKRFAEVVKQYKPGLLLEGPKNE